MKINLLNLWICSEPGYYFSLDVLPIEIRTKKVMWSGSLFALDLTQTYGDIHFLFVFTFNLYWR